jgi:outer membrane biogenesis lipoprotein LolB
VSFQLSGSIPAALSCAANRSARSEPHSKSSPFSFILWRDNLDSDVTIELYDGDKRIQVISPRTASNGVYEWTPKSSVKQGYSLRISSLKNQKIFGSLQLQ